jgi:hypothetical protein
VLSSVFTTTGVIAGWLMKRAPPPVSWPYHGTLCMLSVAAWMPT